MAYGWAITNEGKKEGETVKREGGQNKKTLQSTQDGNKGRQPPGRPVRLACPGKNKVKILKMWRFDSCQEPEKKEKKPDGRVVGLDECAGRCRKYWVEG